MRTARIVGVGSLGAGDDAVGLRVAEILAGRGLEAARVSDATDLVDLALDVELLVIIDAVVGLGPLGAVEVLREEDLAPELQAISTHTMSVPAALAFARLLYPDRVAPAIRLVGVAIEPPAGIAEALSAPVAAAVDRAVNAVLRLLGGDGPTDADPNDEQVANA